MSGIQIDVEARSAKATKDLEQVNASLKNIEQSTSSASRALSATFKGLGATLVAGGSLAYIKNLSTEFTNLENKIATVTGKTKELTIVQTKLFKVAEDTRSSLSDTVNVFSSFGRALKSVGTSNDRILKATKTVQEAIALSGSSAESASAAIIQLGQGLSAGALRGEELNSVMEQAPRIAQAIADELRVSTGELRKLGEEGKLTSSTVFAALLNQAEGINKEFKQLSPTLKQASVFLNDSIKLYINNLDKGLGLSQSLGISTFNLGKNIRNAANNAEELGIRINLAYNKIAGNAKAIGVPLAKSILELGKQLTLAIPTLLPTKTLRGDINEALNIVDKEYLGGIISSFNRFNLKRFIGSFFSIRSDVEKAILELKKLNPKYWAGAGFDIPTLKRFFGKENILAYSKAFNDLYLAIRGNTNGIGKTLSEFANDVDFAYKSVARYFGFSTNTLIAIRRGQLQTFFLTLTEIVKGISGIPIYLFELSRIIKEAILPNSYALINALKDLFSNFPEFLIETIKAILDIGTSLVKIINQLLTDIVIEKDVFDPLIDSFNFVKDTFEEILDSSILSKALNNIREFGQSVINVFKNIYDKVIGNSWWTDTVENIIDTSKTLWDKASGGIVKFKNNVAKAFEDVFKGTKGFKDINLDTIKTKFSVNDNKESIIKTLVQTKDVFVSFFNDVAQAFPDAIRLALTGIAATAVGLLFPASIIRTTIIGALIASISKDATIIAEQFGIALSGGSFIYAFSYRLGQAAGFFVNTIIQELPKVLNLLGSAGSGFIKGISEQLPIIGTILSKIFGAADTLGVAGPLGLFGALYFGKNILDLFKRLDIFTDKIDFIQKLFGISKNDDSKKGEGSIFTWLFGKFGAERSLSIIGLVLQQLGVFDSIFANSPIAELATTGGLLYTAIAGKDAKNNIFKLVQDTVIDPLSSALKNATKDSKVAASLYEIMFGKEGSWDERLAFAAKGLFEKLGASIVEIATPVAKKGFDFVKTILLGKDSTKTVTLFKSIFTGIKDDISLFLAKTKDAFRKTNLYDSINKFKDEANKNAKDSKFSAILSNIFSTTDSKLKDSQDKAAKIGGEYGLLGRAFFGKNGSKILIGSILAVAATAAFAGQENGDSKPTSILDDIKANFSDTSKSIGDSLYNTFLVTLPLALGSLTLFIMGYKRLMGEMAYTNAIDKVTSSLSTFGNTARKIGTTFGPAIAAGIASYSFTNDAAISFAIASLVLEMSMLFRKQIARFFASSIIVALRTAIVSALAAVLTIKGALILAAGAAVGLFSIFFFGEKGEFFTYLTKAKDGILSLFGIKKPSKDQFGLSKEQSQFLTRENITPSFSLKDLNPKDLSKEERKKLEDRLEELRKAIDAAILEEEVTGRITSEQRNTILKLDQGLKNYTGKLEARTADYDLNNLPKDISNAIQVEGFSRFDDSLLFLEQIIKDFAYGTNKFLINQQISLARTPEERRRAAEKLTQLEAEKDTKYNVRFRVPRDADKDIKDLAEKAAKAVNINDPLEKQLKATAKTYINLLEDLNKYQNSQSYGIFSKFFAPDKPIEQIKAEYEKSANEIQDLLKRKITFDQQIKAGKEFGQSLTDITAGLGAIGISFEKNSFFAGTQSEFNRLKELSEQAKILEKILLTVRNIDDYNTVQIQITEIRRQVTQIQDNAQNFDTTRKQDKLSELASSVGLPTYSSDIYRKIEDQPAERVFAAGKAFKRAVEDFQSKVPLDIGKTVSQVGTDEYIRELKAKGTNLTGQQKKSFEEALANIERTRNDFISQYRADVSQNPAIRQDVLRSTAESAGIDFGNAFAGKNVKGAINQLGILEGKLFDLEIAKRSNDFSRIGRLTREIEILKEGLNEAPQTVQDFISSINSLEGNFKLEDVLSLSKSDLSILQSVSTLEKVYEKQIKRLGANASKVALDDLANARANRVKTVFNTLLKTIGDTSSKVQSIFDKLGINLANSVSNITPEIIKTVLSIETIKKQLDRFANEKGSSEFFTDIIKLSDILDKTLKNIAGRLTKLTFGESLSKVNSIFEAGFSELEFIRLPKDIQNFFSEAARYFETNLENIRTKGTLLANDSIDNFILSFEDKIRKAKFTKFFIDFGKKVSEIALSGYKSQFDTIAQTLGDVTFNEQSFAGISRNQRTTFTLEANAISALKEVLTLPGVEANQDVLQRINQGLQSGESLSSIVSGVKDILQNLIGTSEEFAKWNRENLNVNPLIEQTQAIKSNSEAVNSLRDQILNLLTALNQNPTINNTIRNIRPNVTSNSDLADSYVYATGGLISGPGTGMSDSIPAWLSNGEFVVNAASTKKYRKLLENINNAKGFNGGTKGPGGVLTVTAPEQEALLSRILTALQGRSQGLEAGVIGSLGQREQTQARLKRLGVESDPSSIFALNEENYKLLVDKTNNAFNALTQLNTAILEKKPADNLKSNYDTLVADLQEFTSKAFISYGMRLTQAANDFVNTFVDNFSSSFSDALKGKKDDNKSTWKTFTDKILNSFTESVVNTFAKGLLDPFTGPNGIVSNLGKGLAKGLFNLGNSITSDYLMPALDSAKKFIMDKGSGVLDFGKGLLDKVTPTGGFSSLFGIKGDSTQVDTTLTTAASTENLGFLESIWNSLKGGFSQVTGSLGSMLTGLFASSSATLTIPMAIQLGVTQLSAVIMSAATMITTAIATSSIGGSMGGSFSAFGGITDILGKMGGGSGFANMLAAGVIPIATGGKVVGPGTGTSDSIPAMLSNGEFVINAKSAKATLPLLHAINSGNFLKLAEGGMVDTSILSSPSYTNSSKLASTAKSEQIFNINVTGDISKQTKKEILTMLPQITSGVNSQNRENNYSRRTNF